MAISGFLNSGMVANAKLDRPKMKPTIPPTSQPSSTPPMIAGMCMMVALAARLGTGM